MGFLSLTWKFTYYAPSTIGCLDKNGGRAAKDDLEFFKKNFTENKGEQKLNFYVKNPEDQSNMELLSMKTHIDINGNLLEIINEMQKYEVFLN